MNSAPAQPLPRFEVRLSPPDLGPWVAGNTGVPGFTTIESGLPGPHAMLTALIHGNELAGAIVLDRLLRDGIRPLRGQLTCGFVNLAAFARFDTRQPTASRFVDEDMNRVWEAGLLGGPRRSCELDRAREIRGLIDQADLLLDLHSMLWPSDPLILCGTAPAARDLAMAIGEPALVVADHGHASGRRLIDYAPPGAGAGRAAALVEAGQHWQPETVDLTRRCVGGFLRHVGLAEGPPPPRKARFAEVALTVTATSSRFRFVEAFRGGHVVPRRETLIAWDGEREVRTPFDQCLLVMPSLRPSRGHTAVRLAKLHPTPD